MSDFVPRTIESTGKSIDEAIFNGLQSLGVSIDEVSITTVQQAQKGVFGIGAKPCIVRLVERPPDRFDEDLSAPKKREKSADFIREQAEPRQRPAPSEKAVPKPVSAERAPQERRERVSQGEAPQQGNLQSRPQQTSRPEQSSRPQGQKRRSDSRSDGRRSDGRKGERRAEERIVPEDTTVYTKYVPGESNCEGARFVSGVLERMGLDAGLGYAEEGDTLKLKIDSDAMGILIGHRGETLDSLQYLTGLVVNRGEEGYKRVTLDTENYRNKREETLGRLARKIAGQVRATGKPVTLEPMNPYERRVLHFALQNNPYVTTHSEGEEPNRYVIVALKTNAKPSQPQQ